MPIMGVAVADLPIHHRDPFDRLLVALARSEHLAIVTADRVSLPTTCRSSTRLERREVNLGSHTRARHRARLGR